MASGLIAACHPPPLGITMCSLACALPGPPVTRRARAHLLGRNVPARCHLAVAIVGSRASGPAHEPGLVSGALYPLPDEALLRGAHLPTCLCWS